MCALVSDFLYVFKLLLRETMVQKPNLTRAEKSAFYLGGFNTWCLRWTCLALPCDASLISACVCWVLGSESGRPGHRNTASQVLFEMNLFSMREEKSWARARSLWSGHKSQTPSEIPPSPRNGDERQKKRWFLAVKPPSCCTAKSASRFTRSLF